MNTEDSDVYTFSIIWYGIIAAILALIVLAVRSFTPNKEGERSVARGMVLVVCAVFLAALALLMHGW